MKNCTEYELSRNVQYGEKIRIDEKVKAFTKELISMNIDMKIKIDISGNENKKSWFERIFKK